jgi:hypothetical protein
MRTVSASPLLFPKQPEPLEESISMPKPKLFASLAAVAAATVAVSAYANHSWNNYHWARKANPMQLRVVDSVTSRWQFAFVESLSRWGESSKIDNLVVATAEDSKIRRRCPMVYGQMRVCNASYGQNGWLGLASINLDSRGHIVQGTAKFNDSYGWYFDKYAGEDNHVVCQEIGHVYGLGHTSEDGSTQGTCMDYSRSLSSQWPNTHDYTQLDLIYGHTDSYNSYATGSASSSSTSAEDCGQGRCRVPRGEDGDVPPGAVRVHHSEGHDGHLGHADWVMPDGRGGTWLFHATLLPEDEQE